MLIGGALVRDSGEVLEVENPATEQIIARIPTTDATLVLQPVCQQLASGAGGDLRPRGGCDAHHTIGDAVGIASDPRYGLHAYLFSPET